MSKPSKPRSDFPLWPNPNGQWCKKHKGTPYYFGPWNEPEKAEARYKLWEEAGRPPQVPQIDNVTAEPDRTKSAMPKPRKAFPLWPHPNGQWAKRIEGEIRYFGVWDQPEEALAEYHKHLLSQQDSPRLGPLTLGDMVNFFLDEKKQAIPHEMAQCTWNDYARVGKEMIKVLGRTFRVDRMEPKDFARLRAAMAKGRAPTTLSNRMTWVRVIFNWAYQSELIGPPRYGKSFDRPSRTTLRKYRAAQPKKRFSAEQVRALIDTARQPLKAMILLGINCGMGNRDCAHLSHNHLNLEEARFDYARGKTGVHRWGPLWPETVDALREAMKTCPTPKDPSLGDRVFITKYGGSWCSEEKNIDPIAQEMRKLCKELGFHQKGVGFYSLRHTFYTIAKKCKDIEAAKFIMGHVEEANDMGAFYDEDNFDEEEVDVERLNVAVNFVRDWLFKHIEVRADAEDDASEPAQQQA